MIPIVDLESPYRYELTGSAGGGPGTPTRRPLPEGVYVVIVEGDDAAVLIRDGDADSLDLALDPPFRPDAYLAIRMRRGQVTLSTAGSSDARVWLLPVTGSINELAGGRGRCT